MISFKKLTILIHKLGVSLHLFHFLFKCLSIILYNFLSRHLGRKYFLSFIPKDMILFYATIMIALLFHLQFVTRLYELDLLFKY